MRRAIPAVLAVPRAVSLGLLPAVLLACADAAGPPEPVPESERLLTDAELATADDPGAPAENPAYAAWIGANHHALRSLTAESFADLQFLKPLLAGKRVVQLGESGHGVAEFDLVKTRLVKFLHREMGFDVIAFESGLYECSAADSAAFAEAPRETMRRCIFRVWRVEEVEPLFAYIRETRGAARPLRLAGFDPQISSPSTAHFATRPALLKRAVAAVDPAYARRVFSLDSAYLARHDIGGGSFEAWGAYVRDSAAVLMAAYDSVAAFLDANRAALAAAFPSEPAVPRLARQTAWSAARFTEQAILGLTGGGPSLRDRSMAANVEFLLDELYPGKKIILWAHNEHVRHALAERRPADVVLMGNLLAARRRAELYTVGLYMYRGQAADNGGTAYDVARHEAGSMESILWRARKRWIWVDLSRQARQPGNAWMFESTVAKEWGRFAAAMVPRDHYDAILFVDSTRPPRYLPP